MEEEIFMLVSHRTTSLVLAQATGYEKEKETICIMICNINYKKKGFVL
jgi:hypothetical protein